ncbi:MAG: non-heme iron oxygenase ferredoxin subunit [Acidimicrobiales bacterium]
MPEVKVCEVDDVKADSAIRVDIRGHRLAVVRIGHDAWYVLGDRCSHAEASLAAGEVWPDEREIECPKHGSAFSVQSGEAMTLPATQPVPVYDVRVDGNDVLVRVP